MLRRAFWRYWEEMGEVGEDPSDLAEGWGIDGRAFWVGSSLSLEVEDSFPLSPPENTFPFSFSGRVRAWCLSVGRKERSCISGVDMERERLGWRCKSEVLFFELDPLCSVVEKSV